MFTIRKQLFAPGFLSRVGFKMNDFLQLKFLVFILLTTLKTMYKKRYFIIKHILIV